MDRAIFQTMATTQRTHWWFAARRGNLARVVASLDLPASAEILEIGCGCGANLEMLQGHGRVSAVEQDAFAAQVASALPGVDVRLGGLPCDLPFVGPRFDLVCLLDVLEHIADDSAALHAVTPLLTPRGRVLVTVPAYAWLYSSHDRRHHHFRRYTARSLAALAGMAGMRIQRIGYFNTLLFPFAVARRLLDRWAAADDHDLPSPALNAALYRIFAAEGRFIKRRFLPFGLSVIAVLSA